MKFRPFLSAGKKLTNFCGTDLRSRIQFWLKVYMALQCHKIKLLRRFSGWSNLLLRQNKNKIWNLGTFLLLQRNWSTFWGGLFGKQPSVLAQSLNGSSLSQNETPVKVFWFNQFTFQTKESNKIWNLGTFSQLKSNWPIFLGLIWRPKFSFSPKFVWLFSVTK